MTTEWARRHAGRALFLAFNAVALLACYWLVVQPVTRLLVAQAHRLEQRADELARYRALATIEPKVRVLLGQARESGEASTFLDGVDEGAASAALQGHLKQIGEAGGLQIRSIAAIQPETQSGVSYLGAQIDVSGTIGALHEALRNIERGVSPALFVRTLMIRAPATTAVTEGQEPLLNAQIEVFGALRP